MANGGKEVVAREVSIGGALSLVAAGAGAGAVAAGIITSLMAARPVAAAPAEERLDYLISLLEAIAKGQVTIIELLEKIAPAAPTPTPPPTEVSLTVATPWIAKEPQRIFEQAIRAIGVYRTDVMINWTHGKRLLIKAESSLDQPAQLQVVGNISDTFSLATDIGGPVACLANGNASIGLAWGDWQPYIGVRITLAAAPASGLLTLWAVIQE